MDLANAPYLKKQARTADLAIERRARLRVVSVEQLRTPQFLSAWKNLAARASEPNPFFEPWFLIPSLAAYAGANAKAGARVSVLVFYEEGELAGILPVERSHNYYGYPVPHCRGWLHDNAFYGAPLVATGFEEAFWNAVLDHSDQTAGLALFLHMPLLQEGGPLDRALRAVLASSSRANEIVLRRERAMLKSELSSEDYLSQALSKKHRKELRRQRRRLADGGSLTVHRRTDDFATGEWIAEFLALESAGWKGDAGSALAGNAATRNFFTSIIQGAARAGKLERLALRLDGKPVAMLASFLSASGSYSFKTAFDERYAANSPGLQLQIENLDALDRSETEWIDSCAAEGHPMIDRLWTERRQLVSRNIAIGGSVRRAAFRQMMAFETRRKAS
ncbi:GNAT family N-acetyltransferase [Erythrobacter sp. F6033]|uniref:GNAT family N-acetyltransferase n=1 Tax=Erythrobacter sp. F6033 TaxID=2926401 RepID=UPI001FF5E8DA|nr:GNAT family N-acetyltransferase [Erythrobacter sp. F6033]MCK0128848.1 GNAT family N-acetyltransferase [Erythrobacter sp. F6033]